MADSQTALHILAALRRSPVGDAAVLDAGAEGYVPVLRQVETGLGRLLALLERLHA
jgi:hypothetical protein